MLQKPGDVDPVATMSVDGVRFKNSFPMKLYIFNQAVGHSIAAKLKQFNNMCKQGKPGIFAHKR